MVKIKFLLNQQDMIYGFKISGHANYGDYNKDIVCAAISSAAYMTSNMITGILNIKAEVRVSEGYMSVYIPQENLYDCKLILEGLKLHLLELEKSYIKNIKVSEEVVKSDFKN